MALQDFANLTAVVDSDYMSKLTSVSMRHESGQQPIDLLGEGLAGFTPGSGRVQISFNYSVPIGGAEFDFASAVAEGGYHTVQITVGSKTYVGTGKFMDNDISQSVNSATEGSTSWLGELSKLK